MTGWTPGQPGRGRIGSIKPKVVPRVCATEGCDTLNTGKQRGSRDFCRSCWQRMKRAEQRAKDGTPAPKKMLIVERLGEKEAIKLLREVPPEELGKRFGVARSTVWFWRQRLGVAVPHAQRANQDHSTRKTRKPRKMRKPKGTNDLALRWAMKPI